MNASIEQIKQAIETAIATLPAEKLKALQSVIQSRLDALEREIPPREKFLVDTANMGKSGTTREYRVDDDSPSPRAWLAKQTRDMWQR
jgi:hypothetical protein